jgi:hypothetical protein
VKKLLGSHSLVAAVFFVLLSLAATWPLVANFSDQVPGWYAADNYEYLWKMWWFEHALLDLGQNPLFASHIGHPLGFQLAHAELTPLHTVLGLPLTSWLGEIPAYNLFALFSFAITGWATYLLVHRWTGNRWAGLLSGVLLVMSPYHTVRYGGILPLMAIEGLPLTLLGLEIWLGDRSLKGPAIFALGYLLSAWASIYYGFGMLLLGIIYLYVRTTPSLAALRKRSNQRAIALGVLIVLLVIAPLAMPYFQLSSRARLEIPLDETDFWSASPTDYLVPPGLHPLWGAFVRDRLLGVPQEFPQIALEFVLGVGLVTMLFAFYGWRRSQAPPRRAALWLTIAALVLSLGPRLHIGRHPVLLPVGDEILTGYHRVMNAVGTALPSGESYAPLEAEGLAVPLPALLLRWLLPPLTGMRAWNRFAAFVSLGLALLAGLGFAAWVNQELRPARRKLLAPAVLVLAIATFELWPGSIPLQAVQPRAVDLWLAEQPGDFAIMELPLTSALSARQMLHTRTHGKRIAFAYGTYYPYWYREQYPELESCPQPACLELLRDWEIELLLLNLDDMPAGPELVRQLDGSPALERAIELDSIVVYRFTE